MEFLTKLFDTSDFPDRWNCGTWTSFHGWLHIFSDVAVFGAYVALPCIIAYFVLARKDLHFPKLFWLFCAFIFACGIVHLVEASIFWFPVYRLSGVLKFVTAIVSWATVFALARAAPEALKIPSLSSMNQQLEEQNLQLMAAKAELEKTVQESFNSKTLLDATVESMASGLVVFDNKRNYVLANPFATEILGKLVDMPAKDWTETVGIFLNEEDTKPCDENLMPLSRALNGEKIDRMELLIRNGVSAEPKWLRSTATPIYGRDNELLGAVAVFSEITELKRSRAELKRLHEETQTKLIVSDEMLASTLATIPDAIWRAEADETGFNFVYFSPTIEKILGQRPAEMLLGLEDYSQLIHEEDVQRVSKIINRTVEGPDSSSEGEYRLRHKNGQFVWVRNRVSRSEKNGKRFFHGVMTDITEERETQQALIRAQRLTSIGTLAAGIAHEINNPLGAMMLTADRAKTKVDKDEFTKPQISKSFEDVIKQIDRCSKIVSGVLKFATNETSERSPKKFSPVANQATQIVSFKANAKNVSIKIEGGDKHEPDVSMNETEIVQVIANLLANAIDASPVGAEVSVQLEAHPNRFLVSVHDDGKGMTEKMKTVAFDPFFTSRQDAGGTGLGLTMCHTIVAKHGGEIGISDSTLKNGANVWFWLPRNS